MVDIHRWGQRAVPTVQAWTLDGVRAHIGRRPRTLRNQAPDGQPVVGRPQSKSVVPSGRKRQQAQRPTHKGRPWPT